MAGASRMTATERCHSSSCDRRDPERTFSRGRARMMFAAVQRGILVRQGEAPFRARAQRFRPPRPARRQRQSALPRMRGRVPRPRRTFCSQGCVDALLVRTSPSAARGRVFERDRGVCASCGLDTESRKRALARLRRKDPKDETVRKARELAAGFERAVTIRARRPWIAVRRSLWEADHLVPVVEGGGGCGLENLRTLCIPCPPRCHVGARPPSRRRAARSDRAATRRAQDPAASWRCRRPGERRRG